MPQASRSPSYLNFDGATYPWKKGVDYRTHPDLYRVGKGEQGVLIVEPYKSELVKLWRFRTPELAQASADAITGAFLGYMGAHDFVGADMARKFLQMGFTRSRRYANYAGGRKYDKAKCHAELPSGTGDRVKTKSAQIFHAAWKAAEADTDYARLKQKWKHRYG